MTITTSIHSRQPADKRKAQASAAAVTGRRPAAELRAGANPYGDTGCPICGEHAVSSCRCGGPHDESALKNGHGLKCPNGHNWSKGLAYDPATKKFKSDGTSHQPTGETFEDDIIASRATSSHPLEAAAGPLPGQIERVIVSLQNDGRLPIQIPPETMRHVAESLAKYFQTASADKIEQFAEAAKAAVEAELKTENIQTHDTMKADTTGVNVGATPATSRGVLTSFIESATGENIGGLMNMDFFNRIMREVTQGAGQFVSQNLDQETLDAWPALELERLLEVEIPRGFKAGPKGTIVPDPDNDWPSRWEAALEESGDEEAAAAYESTGRMVALKSSDVWASLGDGAGGYTDTLGNPFAPFAFNSGFRTNDVSRDDAVALGLMDDEDEAKPADFDFKSLLNIEAASASGRGALEAGDVEGHEFHGNQWTDFGHEWVSENEINKSDGGVGKSIQYHGTSNVQKTYGGKEVYLTDDPEEAGAYAKDIHRMGLPNEKVTGRQVLTIRRAPGKTLGIDKQLNDSIENGDDPDDVINSKISEAREKGFRYLSFSHPSNVGKSEQKVLVSLFPKEDLRSIRLPKKITASSSAGDVPLVVKCFITDANGRLLVLQADGYGRMDLPGGHLRAGETVEDGLCREVMEETGMTLTDVKELGTVMVPLEGGRPIVFFSAKADTDAPLALSDEHVDWFWLNRHEVALRNFSALTKPVANFMNGQPLEAGAPMSEGKMEAKK